MNRRNFIGKAILGSGVALGPGPIWAAKNRILPNVLLLGDSISLGYTNYVKGLLDGKAIIHRPLNSGGGYLNCEGTTKGIAFLDEWLGKTKWSVIHFNFGLHDLKHVHPETGRNSKNPDHPQQADLETYEKNLTNIVEKLKATGAKLIFATTTSFPDKPGGPLRRADQTEKYNEVALKVMKKYEVTINDLNALTISKLDELQPPRNVHFNAKGTELLAKQVAKVIQQAL